MEEQEEVRERLGAGKKKSGESLSERESVRD